ncbi:TIGR04283 family arsenosugar biosynthesis glycosyltransferase [uncultured Croceitalea sp.]|uniref:TIGR04283 family arsenosugar biosynthesis glycosyltransferase n=1 Tax=uncultured Croceitalea sp. TaxID=1798908 RepID=UPI00374E3F65
MTKGTSPKISIIIPVLNEAKIIGKLLAHLIKNSSTENIKEILLVDGGSTDATTKVAEPFNITIISCKKGRARQLNYGAKKATGELLYFLHADTFPPKGFDTLILNAFLNGAETGCFRMQFDSKNPSLRFFAWLSRINHTLCRGGDQSLFITKSLFSKNFGFNEDYMIYEDSEFISRLYKETKFKILPEKVVTSARKYHQKGWLHVQFHFGIIHLKNYLGASPDELYAYYSKKLLA